MDRGIDRMQDGGGAFVGRPVNSPAQDEVHIWSAELDVAREVLRGLEETLADDEIDRARRFHFDRDRHRFVARRGLLRVLLARYREIAPRAIQFTYGDRGRPELAGGASALRFNLSHSSGRAIYAVANGRSVGVDIERVRPIAEAERISELFFSRPECESLRSLPRDLREIGFFNCWTAKEALLKAWGYGLSYPLDRFAVTLLPSEPARLLWVEGEAQEAARWSLVRLEPVTGYVVTVAAEGEELDLRHRPLLSNQTLHWDRPGVVLE